MNNQVYKLPMALRISAFLMIIFGLAEVVTSFRHEFFGLTTSQATISTIIGATIGCLYLASGFLVLKKKRPNSNRFSLYRCSRPYCNGIIGLYPIAVGYQTFGVVTGTIIVLLFALYIGVQLKRFN